jgi:hypothetical protein
MCEGMNSIKQSRPMNAGILLAVLVLITGCSKLTDNNERNCAEATIAVANSLKELMNAGSDTDPLGIRQSPTKSLQASWAEAHAAAKRWQEKACQSK